MDRARGADTAVLYLATSPHLFPQICEQLGAARLNGPHIRVVLEKPLGHDLASAQEINRVVKSVFSEKQAFRIDHYLGKPSVQNLMALRFGNALFEPLWRARASPTSRSRWPSRWAWARAATSTTAPARCATWCRTTRCSCSR
jgi:Glucose-6-phosphate 1-dehydrogenase